MPEKSYMVETCESKYLLNEVSLAQDHILGASSEELSKDLTNQFNNMTGDRSSLTLVSSTIFDFLSLFSDINSKIFYEFFNGNISPMTIPPFL